MSWITGVGFRQCVSDPCLFIHRCGQELIAVAIHVDDDLVISNSDRLSRWYAKEFAAEFKESPDSTGTATEHDFLGMSIKHDRVAGKLTLSAPRLLGKLAADVGPLT